MAENRRHGLGAGRQLAVGKALQRLPLITEIGVAVVDHLDTDSIEDDQGVLGLQPVDLGLDLADHGSHVSSDLFLVVLELERDTLAEFLFVDGDGYTRVDRPLDHAPQVVHEVGREQHRLQGRFEGRRRVGLKQVLVDRTVEEGRDVEVDLDTRNFLHRLEALAVVGRIELDRRRRDGLQAFRQAGLVEDEFDAVGTVKHEFLADGLGRREQRVAVGVAHVVGRQEVHAGNDLLEQLGAVRADGAVHVVRDCGPGIRNRRAQCGVYSGADVGRCSSKVADDGAGVGAIAVGQGVGICQPTIRQRQRVGLGRLCRLQVRRRRQLRPWKPLRRVRRRHLRLGVKAGALEQRGQEFGKHKRSRELKRLYHMLPVLGKCHLTSSPTSRWAPGTVAAPSHRNTRRLPRGS